MKFTNLKILYSLHLLRKNKSYNNKKNEVIRRIVNTDQAIILSKVIINNGVNEIKLKYNNTIKFTDTLKCISFSK